MWQHWCSHWSNWHPGFPSTPFHPPPKKKQTDGHQIPPDLFLSNGYGCLGLSQETNITQDCRTRQIQALISSCFSWWKGATGTTNGSTPEHRRFEGPCWSKLFLNISKLKKHEKLVTARFDKCMYRCQESIVPNRSKDDLKGAKSYWKITQFSYLEIFNMSIWQEKNPKNVRPCNVTSGIKVVVTLAKARVRARVGSHVGPHYLSTELPGTRNIHELKCLLQLDDCKSIHENGCFTKHP